ncbi:hypothetical protein [Magpiepox virus 2]|nr:hypothetical protein [Magpiepox virus 2]
MKYYRLKLYISLSLFPPWSYCIIRIHLLQVILYPSQTIYFFFTNNL